MNRSPSISMILALASLVALSGCSHLRGDGPLQTLNYGSPRSEGDSGLIVFLRGIGGSHKSFARAGWVDAIADRGLNYTVAAPNTHFGYYRERSLVQRLRDEVVAPAQTEGSDELWLVGVSMGGLGSLFYLKEQAEDVSGVVLISPYLGKKEITEEIAAAGGLRAWDPGELDPEDWGRDLWLWLQQITAAEDGPPLVLAYGHGDRYRASQELLAAVLPPERVITVDGGHRNKVFTRLWQQVLEAGHLDP